MTPWQWIFGAIAFAIALLASAHVLLNKRDERASIGWIGLIWLSPLVGAVLYLVFGVNRIRRRAGRLRGRSGSETDADDSSVPVDSTAPSHLRGLEVMVRTKTGMPLTGGNRVEVLEGGEAAYPAMLEAIRGAASSVELETYIFDADRAGALFADALAEATERGVEVRVLIDAVGARYSRPRMTYVLRRRGVRVADFLPTRLFRHPYLNLRNHRKILVVDGREGFTGGMNIREGCLLDLNPPHPIQDVHFRLRGPIVRQLRDAFRQDWRFTTGERLARSQEPMARAGEVEARAIPDGPDEDFETIQWALLGSLAAAQERVRIVTPYFLPDRTVSTNLRLSALRGVDVQIFIPEHGNLRAVQWACWAQLWQYLESGCRVFLSPPPFDHSKLMVVDDEWSFVGSANWDPRSLRLNFELNVECYDRTLAAQLCRTIGERRARARELTLDEVRARTLAVRLRDNAARLLSPYL